MKIIENIRTPATTPQTINISNVFKQDYYDFLNHRDELFAQSSLFNKIILKIIGDFQNYQFQLKDEYLGPKNQKQYELFEQEFLSADDTYSSRIYSFSDFSSQRKNDFIKVLEFMKTYKNGIYTVKNLAGKSYTTSGGLILNYKILDNTGKFQILISNYWLEKIVKVNTYNTFSYEFLALLKGNKLAFAFWIEALKPTGTKIHFETLNVSLALNYNSSKELAKSFLKPMKTFMDENSLTSYNYSVNGDHINFVNYKTNHIGNLNTANKAFVSVRTKLAYYKRRHAINDEQFKSIKEIITPIKLIGGNVSYVTYDYFMDCYKLFIRNEKSKVGKVTEIKEDEFCNKMNDILKANWTGNENSYPLIKW